MSVWGTGGNAPDAGAFLDGLDHRISSRNGSHHRTSPYAPHGFACATGCVLDHGKPPPRPAPIPCHPCAHLPRLRSQRHAPDPHPKEGNGPRRRLVLTASVLSVRCRYGNIHPFIHSTTPVGLALGPDSPGDDERGPGTLGHPADGILTRLSLLMSAFSLPQSPRHGHPAASPLAGRSPTRRAYTRRRVFGGVLEPRYIVGAGPLDQ